VANLAPLTRSEERDALAIAAADRRLKELAAGRNAPVLIRPIGHGRRQPADARHALLGFYDYERNRAVVAVVDLSGKRIEKVSDSPFQLQLSAKEAREAEQLAGRYPAIRDLLAGRKLNPLTRLYFPPWAGRDDPPHRYAIVFARPSNHERRYAIVDLSEQEVVDVLTPGQIRGQ
jgi:hypothetical protein